jgi:hypothetical protein
MTKSKATCSYHLNHGDVFSKYPTSTMVTEANFVVSIRFEITKLRFF